MSRTGRPPLHPLKEWDAARWLEASRAWVESCFEEVGGCALLLEKANALYAVKWRRHTEEDPQ